eukprot:3567642-Prorocentrum_lima.AAC.1
MAGVCARPESAGLLPMLLAAAPLRLLFCRNCAMRLPWPIPLSPVAPVRAVSELPSGRGEEQQEGDMVGRAR